jgi:hypothetical protein
LANSTYPKFHQKSEIKNVQPNAANAPEFDLLAVGAGKNWGFKIVICGLQLIIPVLTGAVPVTIIMTFNMMGYKLDSPGK